MLSLQLRLFLLLSALFLLFTSREPPWADSHVVYDTTQALVTQGKLSVTLDGHPWFFAIREGRKYGVFPLGNVLAMVPSYLLFKGLRATRLFPEQPLFALTSHFSPALLMAAACALFCGLCRRFGASARAAVRLTLLLAFGTLCLVYARSPYSEALQTLLLLWLVQRTLLAGDRFTAWNLALLGTAAGLLFNAKLVNALVLPPCAVYVLWRAWSSSARAWKPLIVSCLAGGLAFAPFAGLALWHNRLKTGSLWDSGYRMVHGTIFSGDLWPGVYGFLLSTGKGMFFYSPPLILGLLGLGAAWRARRAETALVLSVSLVVLLMNAKFRIWHADYCWGPRHLTALSPLLLLLAVPWLPEALQRGQVWLRRSALAALCAAGLFAQVLGASLYWDHYLRVLITMKDQTGAAGWFHESLSHGHYIPQFSPLRGHLWLLSHLVRKDPALERDVPWTLIVPEPVRLQEAWARLRLDFWALDWDSHKGPRNGLAMLLGLIAVLNGRSVRRRARAEDQRTAVAAG